MAKPKKYTKGDKVNIVGGSYKGKTGVYQDIYGKVMCTVLIDGPIKYSRNIWLTSICLQDDKDTIKISRREFESLQAQLQALTKAMEKLTQKFNAVNK